VLTKTVGVNPAAVTTPSETVSDPFSETSRIGAPRSKVPVANCSVCFAAIYSIDKGSSSYGVIS
jgi:hypothetical protein